MLFKKMLRDLRFHKTSFIAIFLMTFLGMFIYSGLNSEWNGMKVSTQEYYDRTNLADAWIMGGAYSNHDILQLEDNAIVEGRLYMPLSIPQDASKQLDVYAINDHTISQFESVEGVPYDATKDGIWLDVLYANANEIELGNTISMSFQGITIEKEVIGLVRSSEYVFAKNEGQMMPNHKNKGYGFIAKQQESLLANIPDNQLSLKTSQTKDDLQQQIDKSANLKGSTLLMQSEHPSVMMIHNEVMQHKSMSDIFPFAFLLIGFLTTITTMSKLTMDQRSQIGILQALGFPYRKILLHYISHGFVICASGCILGYVLGPILFPPLVYPLLQEIYDIPNLHGVALTSGLFLLILCLALAFLISYATCRRQLKNLPAKTMRPIETSMHHMRILSAFDKSKYFSFITKWNVRDILRNKLRSFMTVFGVMGCSALIFCSSGLYDTMSKLTIWMYQELSTYETKVTLDDTLSLDDKNVLKQHLQGEFLHEDSIQLRFMDIQKTASLTVQENADMLHLQNSNKENQPLPSDGLALSKKMADILQVNIGDELSWKLYSEDTWHTSKVKSIIRTPISQGITMSFTYFENYHKVSPESVLTYQQQTPLEEGIKTIQEKSDLIHDLDMMMQSMNTMIAILILGAVLLGSVVLYNLGTLSFLERQRELATLKVLGFSTKKCKKILSQQNSWLTTIGILLGIPCGYILICMMIATMGESMDVLIQIEILTYVYTMVGTYFVSFIIQLCLARKLKTIDMVSSLKSIE